MIGPWWSVALSLLGGLGWLLVTFDRRHVGFTIGICAQIAWTGYAIATGQWGFILSAVLFGAISLLGLRRVRQEARAQP